MLLDQIVGSGSVVLRGVLCQASHRWLSVLLVSALLAACGGGGGGGGGESQPPELVSDTPRVSDGAPENRAPQIEGSGSIDLTVREDGDPISLILNADDADPGDNAGLKWTITVPAGKGTATVGDSDVGPSQDIDYVLTTNLNGRDTFTVQVQDAQGATDTIEVNVDIQPVNDAPQLTGVPGPQNNQVGDAIAQLSVSAEDVDGDTLTFSASSLPRGLSIDEITGDISGTVAVGAEAESPYRVTVTVDDGNGGADSVEFTWTINPAPDQPPRFTSVPTDQTHFAGETIRPLTVEALDPNNKPLAFKASGLPVGVEIDPNTGIISGTLSPTADTGSPYAVTVTVDNLSGTSNATVNASFSWTVTALPESVSGRAVLGPLANATVRLYAAGDLNTVLATTTTDSTDFFTAGNFSFPGSLIDAGLLYLIEVSGGSDLDSDDDGVEDLTPTVNRGTIYAVVPGRRLLGGSVNVSIVTEVAYRRGWYALQAGYSAEQILSVLDHAARVMLIADVDGSGSEDHNDLLAWDPVTDQAALASPFSQYQGVIAQVHAGGNVVPEALALSRSIAGRVDGLGAFTGSIAIVGDHAYVPSRNGLNVVNIADPYTPILEGAFDRLGIAGKELVVAGGHAYVVGSSALAIYDLNDPVNPRRLGDLLRFPNEPRDVAVLGNHAYVTVGSGTNASLTVVDITDPRAPVVKANVNTPGGSGAVKVVGSHAYIVGNNSFQVVDISDPGAPRLLGSSPCLGGARWKSLPTLYICPAYLPVFRSLT